MKSRLWTKDYICSLISNFFVVFNYYFLLVTLPIYFIEGMEGPKAQTGLIVTMFFISAIAVRPFAGKLIELFGTKLIFLVGLFIYFTATLIYFVADSFLALLLLRFYHGIGWGLVTTSNATIVANIVPNARKGEGMGYFGLSITLGMAVGPLFGLLTIQEYGYALMFVLSALSTLFATIAGIVITHPPFERSQGAKFSIRINDLFEFSVIPIGMVGLLIAFVYSAVVSFVSVYAIEINLAAISNYFFLVCALGLFISRPFTGRMFDKYGANSVMYPAIVCLAFGFLLLSMTESALIFLLAALFVGLGWGTIFPSSQTIAFQVAPAARAGVANATFLFIMDIGIGLGSYIFGLIGAGVGYDSLYFYCALITLFVIVLYYFTHGKVSKKYIVRETSNA